MDIAFHPDPELQADIKIALDRLMRPHPFLRACARERGRVRTTYIDADWLSARLPEAWASNDGLILDRAIMNSQTSLDWWLRPYMPLEQETELATLLQPNMPEEQVARISEDYRSEHAKSNARLVILLDRRDCFRLRRAMTLKPGRRYYDLPVKDEFAWHVENMHQAVLKTVLEVGKEEENDAARGDDIDRLHRAGVRYVALLFSKFLHQAYGPEGPVPGLVEQLQSSFYAGIWNMLYEITEISETLTEKQARPLLKSMLVVCSEHARRMRHLADVAQAEALGLPIPAEGDGEDEDDED